MRCLLIWTFVLVQTLPVNAKAQDSGEDHAATEPDSEFGEPRHEPSVTALAGEEDATPDPNLREPVSSNARGTEVPDIETLSQRAIQHYEQRAIQYRGMESAQRLSKRQQKQQRSRQGGVGRKVGIGVGVFVGAVALGLGIGAAVLASNFEL